MYIVKPFRFNVALLFAAVGGSFSLLFWAANQDWIQLSNLQQTFGARALYVEVIICGFTLLHIASTEKNTNKLDGYPLGLWTIGILTLVIGFGLEFTPIQWFGDTGLWIAPAALAFDVGLLFLTTVKRTRLA